MIAICGNNPDKGIKYRHTWNIVRINGKYYHLDATFDNTLTRNCTIGEEIRYDYFNLEDKSIFRDHEPLIAPAMKCMDGAIVIISIIKKRNCLLQNRKKFTKEHFRWQRKEEF